MNTRRSRAEDVSHSDWAARQQSFGDTPRAVLLKNLPDNVNSLLDSWHRTLLRWGFSPDTSARSGWIVDLGSGYGRMATEAEKLGFTKIVGLDYETGFCAHYQRRHGLAVRGSIVHPPFVENCLSGAYAITAFMYLDIERAIEGLRRLDDCLLPGSRVLLLEAGAEFNRVARMFLRRTQAQTLIVNGFSQTELGRTLLPKNWRTIASGTNAWTTVMLPALLVCSRWPRVFRLLERMVLRLDEPRAGLCDRGWRRFCLHRWVLCEKPLNDLNVA